jgi:hypothetical protein
MCKYHVLDEEADHILSEVKRLLREQGQREVSDSDAILWLADTVNSYVDEIQRLQHELNLWRHSVPVEAMR